MYKIIKKFWLVLFLAVVHFVVIQFSTNTTMLVYSLYTSILIMTTFFIIALLSNKSARSIWFNLPFLKNASYDKTNEECYHMITEGLQTWMLNNPSKTYDDFIKEFTYFKSSQSK